jgi:hypothetical protein
MREEEREETYGGTELWEIWGRYCGGFVVEIWRDRYM